MANERIGRENDSVVKSAGGHDNFLWGNLQTAIAAYQTIVNEQAELMRSGDELSLQGSVAEMHAWEELDAARFALLVANENAEPAVH